MSPLLQFWFDVDGRQYEVDLSATNTEKLREALRTYDAAGQRALLLVSWYSGAGENPSVGEGEQARGLQPRPHSPVH